MSLTNEQLETLKKMDWQGDRGEGAGAFLYFTNTNDALFQEITGICASCLRELFGNDNTMNSFYWEIAYRKHSETYFDLHYAIWCKNDLIKDNVVQVFDTDVLSLFSTEKEPEKTDEEKFIETLKDFIENRPDGDVIELIKQNLTDFWNNIVEDVLENAEEDDIPENLKEDIGRAWAEDNPDDLKEIYLRNASSYDLKDMATEIINDYL